jgi:hypothetical protein
MADAIAMAAKAIDAGSGKLGADTAAKVQRLIEARIGRIIEVVLDAADAGDIAASKLIIERSVPLAKSSPIKKPVELTGTLPEQAAKVGDMLAKGHVTIEEARALQESIEVAQRVRDADARVLRDVCEFRRSEEFWKAVMNEIRAESPSCQERIVSRLARLRRDRGLPDVAVIDAEAEEITPAPLLAPKAKGAST